MDPVQEQLEAYNARDLDRFLACYAEDTVIEDGAGNRVAAGMEAMRALYGPLFLNSPDLHADVPQRIRAGEFTVDQEHVRGVNLAGFPPEMTLAVAYRVRDGRIVHVRLLM